MSVDWVKLRLAQWGRWARGGLPSLPTVSPLWQTQGRGGISNVTMPPDIAEVDHLVCLSSPSEKQVLIVYYTQAGGIISKAQRCKLSRWSFRRTLERAESFVAYRL